MAYWIPEFCENFKPTVDEKPLVAKIVQDEQRIYEVIDFEKEVSIYFIIDLNLYTNIGR